MLRKKPAKATGFLVDENVPADVSDYIAAVGYKVAHIGRNQPFLLEALLKGTPDSLLKKHLQRLVFITMDKRLLAAGALPNKHRSVFVLDVTNTSSLALIQQLFDNTNWAEDPVLKGRKFLIRRDRMEEIEPDCSVSERWW